jgi:hypothetical protein
MDRSTPITTTMDPARAADGRQVLAGRALQASGIIGGISLVFLVLMFAAFGAGARDPGMTFGWVNDVLGLVSCALALPAVVGLHRLLARGRPG